MLTPPITWAVALVILVGLSEIASQQYDTFCHQRHSPHRRESERVRQIRNGFNHQFYHDPKPGHILVGRGYGTKIARSFSDCAVHCLQEDACKSFNFCQDDKQCELNSAVYYKSESDLVPSSGCLYFDEEFHEVFCDAPVGIENGATGLVTVPDQAFRASSIDETGNRYSKAAYARLNYIPKSNEVGAWEPSIHVPGQWVEVNLGENVIISGVITQGRQDRTDQWVTKFKVLYTTLDNPSTYSVITTNGEEQIFDGNIDTATPVTNYFVQPVLANIIRIVPTAWERFIKLRFELIGCLP